MTGSGMTYGNSSYRIVEGPTWSEAAAAAKNLGGFLASISTEEEFNFLLQNDFKGWIGLSNPGNSGPVNSDGSRAGWNRNGFRWESGEKYQFEAWMQPVFNTDGNYVHFWDGHGGGGSTVMLATNETPPNADWWEGKGIAEIPLGTFESTTSTSVSTSSTSSSVSTSSTSASTTTSSSASEATVIDQQTSSMNITKISIENTILAGRRYWGNTMDLLTGQKDFSFGLLDGNDFLEVVGGANNFANGNNGADNIVVRGGHGRYLGGADNDRLEVFGADSGTWVNGNRGQDIVTGIIDGVTYRGGSENDILQVSAGTVWGDKGADTFQAVAGEGVAIVQDYTLGEDVIQGISGGAFTATSDGLVYGVGDDQMLLLAGITDVSQVTFI